MACWSFSFLTAQWLQVDLSVSEALAARFVPVLVVSTVLIVVRRPRLPRRAWLRLVLMGFFSVVGYNVFFFLGLRTVPSGTAALIIALAPVFIAVLARLFYGESFGGRKILGLVLSLLGLYIVVRYGTFKPVDWPYVSGALLLALAPLSWAFYTVLGRGLADLDPFDVTLVSLVVGSLPTPLLLSWHTLATLAADRRALASALFLSIVCVVIGYAVWIWALKKLPAGEVAAFVFLNPPFASLWSWLFEGTPVKSVFALGGVVLLAGVACILFRRPIRIAAID